MMNKLVLSAATNRRLEELVSRSALTRGVVRRYVAGTHGR